MLQQLMQDSVEVKIDGILYKIFKLRPWHFLECHGGIPFDIFNRPKKEVGLYAQMVRDLEEQEPERTDESIIHQVLEFGVFGFNYEQAKQQQTQEHIDSLLNMVMGFSLDTFNRVFEPNNQMLINLHLLAKEYGKTPADFAKMPIDEFLLSWYCLISGTDEEKRLLEQQAKKS